MNEPLKNKRGFWNNEDRYFEYCNEYGQFFEEDDVASAVKWLKEKIEMKDGVYLGEEERDDMFEVLDEAFADVVEERRG